MKKFYNHFSNKAKVTNIATAIPHICKSCKMIKITKNWIGKDKT